MAHTINLHADDQAIYLKTGPVAQSFSKRIDRTFLVIVFLDWLFSNRLRYTR
jgi:hypothetical protein